MGKHRHKKKTNKAKENIGSENEIFKKYAAPRYETFLYFEKLQRDFYLKNASD